MPDALSAADIAARLADAWRNDQQPEELLAVVRPASLAAGYDIQDELIAALGHPIKGWKIGMSGRSAYRGAGLESAIFGRIVAPHLFRSGAAVPVPPQRAVTVELEFVLVLARNIGPGDAIDATAIAATHLGFEIVSSRLPRRQSIGVAATVADNGVSHAVVLGERIAEQDLGKIAAQASVIANRSERAAGLAGDDLALPFDVLGQLVRHASARGQKLLEGDVIFTGTMIKPFDTVAPARLDAASCGARVSCRLVAPG